MIEAADLTPHRSTLFVLGVLELITGSWVTARLVTTLRSTMFAEPRSVAMVIGLLCVYLFYGFSGLLLLRNKGLKLSILAHCLQIIRIRIGRTVFYALGLPSLLVMIQDGRVVLQLRVAPEAAFAVMTGTGFEFGVNVVAFMSLAFLVKVSRSGFSRTEALDE